MTIIKDSYVADPKSEKPEALSKKAPEETTAEWMKQRRLEKEELLKLRIVEEDLDKRSVKNDIPPTSKDDVSWGKLMLEMVKDERSVRDSAEKAKTQAEKDMMEVIADSIKGERQRLEADRASNVDPLEGFRRYKQFEIELRGELEKNLQKAPTAGMDAQTAIMLKKMELDHSIVLVNLQNDMQERKMAWDLKLKQWDDERLTKKEQWERSQKTKEDALGSLTDLGTSLAQNISLARGAEGVASQPSPQQVRYQPPPVVEGQEEEQVDLTMTAGPCPACGDRIEIPSDANSITCAKCGTTFKVKRRQPA